MIIKKSTATLFKTFAIAMVLMPLVLHLGINYELIDKGVNYPQTDRGELFLIVGYLLCQIFGASIYLSVQKV